MLFSTREALKFDDVLSFGKYKGSKICVIMAKDIRYIRYLSLKGIVFDVRIEKCLKSIKSDKFVK